MKTYRLILLAIALLAMAITPVYYVTGEGNVTIDNIQFNVREQCEKYLNLKGEIFACGTCLKSRNKEGSNVCPLSTMQDLMSIVEESDKILSF